MDLLIANNFDMVFTWSCLALFLAIVFVFFTNKGTEIRLILAGLGLFVLIPAIRIFSLHNYIVIRVNYGHYEGIALIVLTIIALGLITAGAIIIAIDNRVRSSRRVKATNQDTSVEKK